MSLASHDTLHMEWVPLDSLTPNPDNPRDNDAAVPHVAASIKRFGWQQPIVAKPSGEILAGHTRWKAARHLRLTEVPVVRFEGSDLEAVAYSIADNRLHDLSSFVDSMLADVLVELRSEDALDGVGYTPDDIDALIGELQGAASAPIEVDDPGPEEPPATPVTRPGDLWVLGNHRLLCGDSTKAFDLDRLLDGDRPALLSTDPPYCVGYTGKDRPIHNGKPSGKDWSHVYREVDIADLGEFLDSVLSACLPHVREDAAIYLWHAHVQQPTIAKTFEHHGLLLHQMIVWVKPVGVFGHSYYRWRHETCAFGWKKGNKPTHGTGKLDTVWECDWEGKARVVGNKHPTQKPLRVFEIPMEQHTQPGAIVLEPFSGSGSQILAAEKLGRKCRGMEITPTFVDGAILRWQKATGKTATLDGTGSSYAEVAQDRGIRVDPAGGP